MRAILFGVFLTCCFSITAIAGDRSIIHSFLADLDQNIHSVIGRLQAAGYTESPDTVFQQAELRVFMKAENGVRPVTYIIEQCNNKVTGYTREILSMDEVLLLQVLKQQGYKKSSCVNGEKYRKGNITIELYYDDNRPLLARRYIHVSRKSDCNHDHLFSVSGSELNLRPSNLKEMLANLKGRRTDIALAAARGGFASFYEEGAGNVVTYVKPLQSFRVTYCHNKVQYFELELSEKEGRGLVESIEKMNFQKLNEEAADNNAYTRTYTTDVCEVTVYYYGNKYGRGFNENAYKIVLFHKNTCI